MGAAVPLSEQSELVGKLLKPGEEARSFSDESSEDSDESAEILEKPEAEKKGKWDGKTVTNIHYNIIYIDKPAWAVGKEGSMKAKFFNSSLTLILIHPDTNICFISSASYWI